MYFLADRSDYILTALLCGQPFTSVQRKHNVPQMRREFI